jgi:hypothetical protein
MAAVGNDSNCNIALRQRARVMKRHDGEPKPEVQPNDPDLKSWSAHLVGGRSFTSLASWRLLPIRRRSSRPKPSGSHFTSSPPMLGNTGCSRQRIDVRWGCDGNSLTMSWTERDGPPVTVPERRGFGTTVMKEMAECSLDGAGLIWRLTCPATRVLDPRWSPDSQVSTFPA